MFGPNRIYKVVRNKILEKTECNELSGEFEQTRVDDEIICTEAKSRMSYINGDSGGKNIGIIGSSIFVGRYFENLQSQLRMCTQAY